MKTKAVVVSIGIALTIPTSAQTWSTGYFNTNDGYISEGSSLDGQPTNAPGTAQWQTTDPYEPSSGRGSTSLVPCPA